MREHVRTIAVTAIVSLGFVQSALSEVAAPPRQVVTKVVVDAGDTARESQARSYVLPRIRTREGAVLSQRDLASDERDLLDSDLFSSVAILAEPDGEDGVAIIYRVALAPRLRLPIEVSGNKRFSKSKVRSKLGRGGAPH